jgi:hypothetical protein
VCSRNFRLNWPKIVARSWQQSYGLRGFVVASVADLRFGALLPPGSGPGLNFFSEFGLDPDTDPGLENGQIRIRDKTSRFGNTGSSRLSCEE